MPLSFATYLELLATSSEPLNQVALDYWHDWQTNTPIDGGVAFEPVLRKLALDGSLDSLTLLDRFLDALKPHLTTDMLQLNQRPEQRNLLLFIAFYSGLVLGYHAKISTQKHEPLPPACIPQWLTFDNLILIYPPLQRLIKPDFSYSIAMSLQPIEVKSATFMPTIFSDSVYFPLVTIIERLYPRRENLLTTTAPHFGYIDNSLHASVCELLARWQTFYQSENNTTGEPSTLTSAAKTHAPATTASSSILVAPNGASPHPHPQSPVTTVVATFATDLDNPLMERKDWQNPVIKSANHHQQPVITHRSYVIPDFSALSMDAPTNELIDQSNQQTGTFDTQPASDDEHMNISVHKSIPSAILSNNATLSNQATDAQQSTSTIVNTQPTANSKQPNTQTLSSRQAIAEAKLQAKQVAKAKAERAAKLQAQAEALRQAKIAEALANPRIHENLQHQRKSLIAERPKYQDSYSELEQDLQQVFLPDDMPEITRQHYTQAVETLQTATADQEHFRQAYSIITSNHDLSDSMLRQALYYLRGEKTLAIAQDGEMAIKLIKAAANLQDNRAQKLLSKLYFSGELVELDREQGKFWLDQAATNGHLEAKKLQQSFLLVDNLKDTRQDEDNYLKKLLVGVCALIVFAMIVLMLKI